MVLLVGSVVAYGAGAGEGPMADRIAAVATTNIVGDVVIRIGGDRLALYVMLPSGADPHVFRPTPRDARYVADADVVFANGLGLEDGFLAGLLASAAPRRVVELSEHLALRRMDDAEEHASEDEDDHEGEDRYAKDTYADREEHEHGHGEIDPHVWMDPTFVVGWAAAITAVLIEIDPEHAAAYDRRAAALTAELYALDAWVHDQVSSVPSSRRVLMTDHVVLGYFARRYGFELEDSIIPGLSTVSEPSARHLAELRDAIVEHGVSTIFVGTTVNPQVAQAVANDLGINVVTLYTGSLSESDGPAATYQDFIRTNVQRIVSALSVD